MNFDKLPTELVTSIMNKCNYETVVMIRKTNSRMNNIAYNYHKLDAESIYFDNPISENAVVRVEVRMQRQSNNSDIVRFYKIEENDVPPISKPYHHMVNDKVKEILLNIASTEFVEFNALFIDETFLWMLQSLPIDWKHVKVDFFECDYHIPTKDLLLLWKMFKTTHDYDSCFNGQYDASNIINDELMVQLLPNITINTEDYSKPFPPNPNLTDTTLRYLAQNKPKKLAMRCFISSFTAEGVLELFKKIIHSRDSSIASWRLGVVEYDNDTLTRLLNDFEQFNTEFSKVYIYREWTNNSLVLQVVYNKENTNETVSVAVIMIKPPEFVAERLWIVENQHNIIQDDNGIRLREELPELDDDIDIDKENENLDELDENNNNIYM